MGDLFYNIVNMSIAASWLIVAVIILRAFLKKVPRKITCCLWALVALRLICPFTIESRLSLIPDVKLPAMAAYESNTLDGDTSRMGVLLQNGTNNMMGDGTDAASDSEAGLMNSADSSGNSADSSKNSMDGAGNSLNDSANSPAGNSVKDSADSRIDAASEGYPGSPAAVDEKITGITANVINAASVIWLVGVMALLVYALFTYIKIRRRTAASVSIGENIYVCDDIDTPFILGVFRTRIFIPSVLSEEERGYVLAHERAHLKRLDNLWKPLGYLILSVYWFNPLVWVSYILLCRDIEIACDERVISDKDTEYKKKYATTLLNCSVQGGYITACPLAFGETSVKQRIKAVLNYKKPAFWVIIVAVIACAAAAVGFMTSPSSKNDKTESESVSESETSGESSSETEDIQTETQSEQVSDNGTGGEQESSTLDIIPARAVNYRRWHIWVRERKDYKYDYDTAELRINDGENTLYLTAFDLTSDMYSYDELKENENLGAWNIVQYDGELEEFTESAGVGLSIYRYEESGGYASDGTGYVLIYGESGNETVWYMIMPAGMTLDEVKDFASDIYPEIGNSFGRLSYMEQYERIVNKEGFLSSYTDSGESIFKLYAAELKERRPEKYEMLKDPVSAVCVLYDIKAKSSEVFHNEVGWDIAVVHADDGADYIGSMRLKGELWMVWYMYDSPQDFDYETYRARERKLKSLSADELRKLDAEINPLDVLLGSSGDEGWTALAKVDGEDTMLYGDYSGSAIALRHEDKVIAMQMSYLSPRISIPQIYAGDFDNDGSTEYSIWICSLTGSGVSCDQLFMLETDWNAADDGSIEYSIYEYQSYYYNQETAKIDCRYDNESKILTVVYNGEVVDTADLTKHFEDYPGEYRGVYFGDQVSFTYSDGQWYYETVGGIVRKNSGMVNYQYSVHLRGRVVYDGRYFGLEDTQVWVENAVYETN